MPVKKIPAADKKWEVNYLGEYYGDIIDSFNVDLTSFQGRIGLSNRMYPHTHSDTTSGLTIPTQFNYCNSDGTIRYWMVADKLYNTIYLAITAFTADATASSPTGLTDSDLAVFYKNSNGYDVMLVSTATDVAKLEKTSGAATWTTNWFSTLTSSQALITGYSHPLAIFQRVLIVGDKNAIHLVLWNGGVDDYTVVLNELTFSTDYYVSWIQCTKDKIFIGLNNNKASGFPYGSSAVVEYDYFNKLSRTIEIQEGQTIGFLWDNNINIVDAKGNVKFYNGSYFESYTYFPTAFQKDVIFSLPHRNGIIIREGRPHFLITGDTYTQGGIWIYEPENKRLYRRYSLTYSTSILRDYGTDYGQAGGALFFDGFVTLTAGAKIYKTNLGNFYAVFYSNPTAISTSTSKRGYIVLSKLNSDMIDNIWKNVLVKYNSNVQGTQTGKITLKYRKEDPSFLWYRNGVSGLAQGTWSDNTTISFLGSAITGVAIGDEILIVAGDGAGHSANITNITGTTTKTLTLDQAIVETVSGLVWARFTNFKPLSVLATGEGTITINGTTSIVGSGTHFLRDFVAGAEIIVGYQAPRIIDTITSDTAMTSTVAFQGSSSGYSYYYYPYKGTSVSDATKDWCLMDLPTNAISDTLQLKVLIENGFQLEELNVGYQPNLIQEK